VTAVNMKMFSTRRTTDRSESYFCIWVVTVALVTVLIGCESGQKHSTAPTPPERRVSVAVVAWDAFSDQYELAMLLVTNGIHAALDGSKLLDVVVPQSQATKAMALLETNHVVLEKKVFLSRPPN